MTWPVTPGRYKIGNKDSPVAVCTMASVNLKLPMDKIAIVGKVVTENVGVEKIVKNMISNPKLRFLICCGKLSKGHFVGDALECLVKKGVDKDKRIINARGAMPILKNLTDKEIERFRKQVEVICMQGEENTNKIMERVEVCLKKNPGPFAGVPLKSKKIKTIVADYDENKEFTADEKPDSCSFDIVLERDKKQIIVERYLGYGKERKHDCNIMGKTTEEIMGTLVKKKLICKLYHSAYLAKELKKAEIALKENREYEQDEEL